MNNSTTAYFADIQGLRLSAFISDIYGSWSAAVYDLKEHTYVVKVEPLPPKQDTEEDAKNEALRLAAVCLGKSADEIEAPVWRTSSPSPR